MKESPEDNDAVERERLFEVMHDTLEHIEAMEIEVDRELRHAKVWNKVLIGTIVAQLAALVSQLI